MPAWPDLRGEPTIRQLAAHVLTPGGGL